MPVNSTFASLSKNGYGGNFTGKTYDQWISTFDQDLYDSQSATLDLNAEIASMSMNQTTIIAFGYATGRPSFTEVNENFVSLLSASTGAVLSSYNTSAVVYDAVLDSSNNQYVLMAGNIIMKLNSAGVVQYTKTVSGDPLYKIRVNSAGDLLVAGFTTTTTYLYKLNSSTLSVTWAKSLATFSNLNNDTQTFDIQIDSSSNIVLMVTSSGIGFRHNIIKFSNGGSVVWQLNTALLFNSTFARMTIDSSDDIYFKMRTGSGGGPTDDKIIKLSSLGVKQFEVFLANTFYDSIGINSAGTISLLIGSEWNTSNFSVYNVSTGGAGLSVGTFTAPFGDRIPLSPEPTIYGITPLLCRNSTNLFAVANFHNISGATSRSIAAVTKLNSDGTTSGINSNYNFTIQGHTYNGTVTSSISGSFSLTASTAISFSATTYTVSNPTITSSDTTITLTNFYPVVNIIGLV